MLVSCEELFIFPTENVLRKISGATKTVGLAEGMNLSERAVLAHTSLKEFHTGAPSFQQRQTWSCQSSQPSERSPHLTP